MHSWASLWIFEFCIAPPTYSNAIFATQPQYTSVASYILTGKQTLIEAATAARGFVYMMHHHHHHHVPSSCRGLDAMVLHSWRCCACLTAWWYSSPVHLVMFVVHFVLGLPRPLEPFTLPSKTVRCSVSPFWRMMCSKYCSFFCLYDVV